MSDNLDVMRGVHKQSHLCSGVSLSFSVRVELWSFLKETVDPKMLFFCEILHSDVLLFWYVYAVFLFF